MTEPKKGLRWRARWKIFSDVARENIDVHDLLYVAGVGMIAVGAGWFHIGAGWVAAGLGTVFPFVLVMLRSGVPPKGKP